MVYDEGFEISVGGHNFFAFSNFTFEEDPDTKISHNVSHCDHTQIGWYQNMDRTEYGCFYGYKTEKQAAVAKPAVPAVKMVKKANTSDTVLDHKAMTHKVDKLNKKLAMLQLGWKARVMPRWIGKTVGEINTYAGLQRKNSMRDMQKEMLKQRATTSKMTFLQ